jgi:enterochelin esterase-like enzyme
MRNIFQPIMVFVTFMTLAADVGAQSMKTSAGILDSFTINSPRIGNRTIYYWLPSAEFIKGSTSYADQKLSVLYMHDGQMLFDKNVTWNGQEWHVDEHLDSLVSIGLIPPTMVVGIANGGPHRHREYFPQKPLQFMNAEDRETLLSGERPGGPSLFSGPICSDDYVAFLVHELKPYILTHFRVKSEKEGHFLMGSSMGGLISVYALCEYPDEFGGAACLSTHWPGTFVLDDSNLFPQAMRTYLEAKIPHLTHHTLYFDFGTETLDAFYEKDQTLVDTLMNATAPKDLRWITRKFDGEAHTEEAWSKRFCEITLWIWGN